MALEGAELTFLGKSMKMFAMLQLYLRRNCLF